MKKRILFLVACFAVVFTAMAYMDINNPFVSTAAAKSGTQGGTTISSNTTWNLDGDLTLTGTVRVKSGKTLKIYNDSATRTIKRGANFTGDMFYVEEGATLHINGTGVGGGCYGDWTGAVIVDGNANYTATGQIIDCSGKLSLRDTVVRNNKGYNAIWLGGPGAGTATDVHHYTTIEITRTKIENCNAVSGGGVMIAANTPAGYTVEIWDSLFYKCTAVDGSAVYFSGAGQADVLMLECVVDDCDQVTSYVEDTTGYYGGALRTNGNGRFKFEMRDSILRNCDSWKFGGGIYWNASGTGSELLVNDCQFLNNSAAEMGGGMFLEGSNMTITATKGTPSAAHTTGFPGSDLVGTIIEGNYAPNGGGISYKCYSNSAEVQVPTTVADFNENVIFKDNTGKNGPALAYNLHDTHNYPNGATFTFNINGAQFLNNVGTGYGGAIYVRKCRTDYVCTVNFNSGTITNNSAANGGAIAIVTDSGVTKGGTINMKGGTLSNNTASADGGALYVQKGNFNLSGGTVKENKAANGGAGALTEGNFKMSGGTLINNTATSNGGAVHVSGGNFEMLTGEIKNNTATSNGGAAYVTGGTFTITGGTLSGNTASSKGGAAYVAGSGSVKGNFTMSGGTLNNNTATSDGGAAYVSGGNFKMTGGTVQKNSALNGGAVYVNGGDFNMISGTLTENTAIEKTAGAAEAGNEGYGGGVYAANGNIRIGVDGCKGTGDKHTETYTSLKHPIVTKNKGVFGGALAVNGGKVYIYCGDMKENKSDNDGTGMNVFMTGDNSEIYHYIESAEIGEDENHGMVSVGGTLTIVHGSDNQYIIKITYFSNSIENEDGVEIVWTGVAPHGYYLNLPYCPSAWQQEQAGNDLMFVGWTKERLREGPSAIRERDDYLAIGTPVEMEDLVSDSDPDTGRINFYAVWAPLVNNISYTYSLDGETIVSEKDDLTDFTGVPTTYTCSNVSSELVIPDASRRGYTFKGWKMYAKNTTISNWDMDATTYDPTLVSHIKPADSYVEFPISLLQSFGDIEMVAIFEPKYADLEIVKDGIDQSKDSDETVVFVITGDPYDEMLDQFTMETVAVGNDTVNIKDLPVGDYIITEKEDWSWRYDVESVDIENAAGTVNDNCVEISLTNPDKTVKIGFDNIRNKPYWLSDKHHADNWWGSGVLKNRVVNRADN